MTSACRWNRSWSAQSSPNPASSWPRSRPTARSGSSRTAPIRPSRSSADRQRLTQILVNLISNAIKYNRRGGTVTLTCQPEGTGHASLTVADTGPGIAGRKPRPHLRPLRAARRRAERDRGHRHRPAAGPGPHRGHARAPHCIEHSRAGIDLHHHPPARPGPRPRPSTRPAAPAVTGAPDRDDPGRSQHPRSLHRGQPGEHRSGSPVPAQQTSYPAPGPGIPARLASKTPPRTVPTSSCSTCTCPTCTETRYSASSRPSPAPPAIPVVVLSADASHGVIRRLLAAGALAYLTKPIELAELGQLLDTIAAARAQDRQAQPAIQVHQHEQPARRASSPGTSPGTCKGRPGPTLCFTSRTTRTTSAWFKPCSGAARTSSCTWP